MSNLKHLLWLALKQVIPTDKKHRLLDYFGDISTIYMSGEDRFLECGILNQKQILALLDKDFTETDIVLSKCEKFGIDILAFGDSNYPTALQNIFDPPLILYTKGKKINLDNKIMIAMVGTRKTTAYGSIITENLAFNLAKNDVIIVSGMASGIDTHAHIGTLKAGGQTIAVLGCGVDICYPTSNKILMSDIIATGMVISEYPPGTRPEGHHFPARNRIISGLCHGTIICEAPLRSGALITANYALEQGREVFAIPANIDSINSMGCNKLIREGAGLVDSAECILSAFEWVTGKLPHEDLLHKKLASDKRENTATLGLSPKPKEKPKLNLEAFTETQRKIITAIGSGATSNEEIIEKTGLPPAVTTSSITILEVQGVIGTENGRLILKNS